MRTPASFILALAVVFFSEAGATTFTIKNNCPSTVWPASLTGAGQAILTGFELAPQASASLDVSGKWSGRFWARSDCSTDPSGKFTCATGDCASGQIPCNGAGGIPPVSLVEFTLAGDQGKDFYDVSLVDGYNLALSITPQGGTAGPGQCNSASCPSNVNQACPIELQLTGQDGGIIGCKSACLAFNQPQYCCTGAFGTPATCPPTSYSQIFKTQCPQAYSYAYDDATSTFTCPTGANYLVTFCP